MAHRVDSIFFMIDLVGCFNLGINIHSKVNELWPVAYKVTTLGETLTRNTYAMFGFIPFRGSLKKGMCMYFP